MMRQNDEEIKAIIKQSIDERKKEIRDGKKIDDLLGRLLESNLKEIQEHGSENDYHNINVGLSVEDIVKECKLFYFAGQETTAALLVWTMVLLSRHPNWQSLARDEVLTILGTNKPNVDGLNHLKVVSVYINTFLSTSQLYLDNH